MEDVVFWCIIVLSLIHVSLGLEHKPLTWEVEYMYKSPDCLENIVMAINGTFPGPTIRAKEGDTIVVDLVNKLHTEGVVIHWHGIRQRGTPWADGTASISQCAIDPGDTFRYNFTVDKAGTYFYHGHYGMQRSAGLYGSLIVEDAEKNPFCKRENEPNCYKYDGELNLLLSDWWHKGTHEQQVGLSSNPYRWIGEPQSLLINGRGQFNCSLAANYSKEKVSQCNFTGNEESECAPQILEVEPNKIYRLRIASTTALASLNLAIEGHNMTVVEADGNYVEPFNVTDLYIYSGESYSVLIETNQISSKSYWISVGVIGREPDTPQALAVLSYSNPSNTRRFNITADLPTSEPPKTPLWNNYSRGKEFAESIFAREGSPEPVRNTSPIRRIILLNTQNRINKFYKWSINNVSLVLPPTPYLGSLKFKLNNTFDQKSPPDYYDGTTYHIVNPTSNPNSLPDVPIIPLDYDIMKPPVNENSIYGNGIYNFTLNETVDVILQNANVMKEGASEIHPWHLHGHDFWVLGYGEGKFKAGDEKRFNLRNKPPLRNTVVLFPYGWTALRFRADNPGVWAFHCHIEPHLHLGMGVVFAEGIDEIGKMKIPREALACGLTAPMSAGPRARPPLSILNFVSMLLIYYVVTSGFNSAGRIFKTD